VLRGGADIAPGGGRNGFAGALSRSSMVFEEFVVPDPLVAGTLALAVLTVGVLLYSLRLRVSQGTALAFVPWMVSGAVLHVLYQMDATVEETLIPAVPTSILSAPSVYLTASVLMGLVWLLAALANPERPLRVAKLLAGTGVVAATAVGGYAAWVAADQFALDPVLPLFGLLGSLAVTAVLYLGLGLWRPDVVAGARYVGGLVLFAHVFDGITTAIGIELLDTGERSTVPQLVLDVAADLPTSSLIGDAWLFVLVKVLIATLIVASFHDYVRERPTEGNLFFAFVAAVGLGPATNNFLLFALGV
jgi:uncharacterized membrane protein